jgi:hypothetical protein
MTDVGLEEYMALRFSINSATPEYELRKRSGSARPGRG